MNSDIRMMNVEDQADLKSFEQDDTKEQNQLMLIQARIRGLPAAEAEACEEVAIALVEAETHLRLLERANANDHK